MKKEQKEFFEIMTAFRKLNVSKIMKGISHGDFHLLKIIDCCKDKAGNSVKISDIIGEAKMMAPAVSRALKNLEEKGLIIRTIDKCDRRNTLVSLTEKGENTLRQGEAELEDFASAVFQKMGEGDMKKLNEFMKKFIDTANREIDLRTEKGRKTEDEKNI